MTSVSIAEVPVGAETAAEAADAAAESAEAETAEAETAEADAAATAESGAAEAAEPQTPAPKRRGRPPGSKTRKEPPPPPQPKAKPKAKKKAIVAPVDDEPAEALPEYVQRDLPPPQPQDLATALLGLMQTHERERVGRKRAQYASWVSRF